MRGRRLLDGSKHSTNPDAVRSRTRRRRQRLLGERTTFDGYDVAWVDRSQVPARLNEAPEFEPTAQCNERLSDTWLEDSGTRIARAITSNQ